MNLPGLSVRRPVFTTMVTLIVLVVGGMALSRLKIDMLPDVELPTLSIRTTYEGASPEVMEHQVTRILEEIVATVPGVEEMTSVSSEGNSTITLSFGWGTDIDIAALDVQSVVEDELDELPDDADRPRIRKFDIASFPVVVLGISSPLPPVELTRLIENQIRYRFARIPGVAQVDVWGGFNREVRIEISPERIKALGLAFDQVIGALRNANMDEPAGRLDRGRYSVILRAPADYTDLDQIRNTVVLQRAGAAIRLGQIAQVKETYEKLTRIIRVNGERGVRVAVRKESSANTVEVARRILAEIDAINSDFPQVHVIPVINQGNFIERSIRNVAQSVMYGSGLAVLVLLVFLRTVRSTLVISLSIPISMVATFALMFFGKYTLNLMTLGGLALGAGMMVDSSIVVLENIFRRKTENREDAVKASVEGAGEVGPAIVASTATTLVIFLPLIFVRGVAGVLFTEMAYVIMFALICSLLVALSLVPMLTSRLLAIDTQGRRAPFLNRIFLTSEVFFTRLTEAYGRLLDRVLNRPLTTILVSFVLLGASLLLVPMIGTELLPPSDEGEVRVYGTMENGTRLDLVDRQTRKIEALLYPAVPEAVSSVVSVGASGRDPSKASRGEIRMSLTPAASRTRSNKDIAQDLRARLTGKIPGMDIRTRAPQGQFLLERILGGDDGISVDIRGRDLNVLGRLAKQVSAEILAVSGITDIDVSQEEGIPQQEILVDRNRAADLGLSVRDVTDVLSTAVVGAKAGEFRNDGDSCRILVQLENAEKRSLDEILDLTLTAASGKRVPIRSLVTAREGRGPILISRKDQQRVVTVSANVSGRALGSVAAEIQERLAAVPRPDGYELAVAGNYEEQQKAFNELVVSLGLALLLVYMVMACQYESFINPLVVMFSVPLAAVGVLVTLFLTHTTLNIQSYIGCIMLGGIVVNNAILLVDQAGKLSAEGFSVREAVAEAGRRRLRPILMTTLTTILGLFPLALGIGEGAEAQAPLARAVVGGLTGSTLITLVLIPAVYALFHSKERTRS